MNRRDKFIFYFVLLFVIVPGAISFFVKVESFFKVEMEEGMSGFALPYLNYLFVALGFLCLFIWAYLNGHFKDIERPATEMLEMNEEFEEMEKMMKKLRRDQDGKFGKR